MTQASRPVRVWDAPTRVFHWALAGAVFSAWLTRKAQYLDLHVFCGYAIGLLVAFRYVWGFIGTRWARFASFPLSISSAAHYLRELLRGRVIHYTGHNPAGSWAIHGLLAAAAILVGTGIVALGAEHAQGPLAGAFSYEAGDSAHLAHQWLAYGLLGLVGMHLLGVLVGSLADHQNLVRAMLVGSKRIAGAANAVELRGAVAGMLGLLIILGGCAYFRGNPLAGQARATRPPAPLAADKTWQDECGGCHLAFHPSLLPARSWAQLLAGQDEHFGEELGISARKLQLLSAFASAHAAEALESSVAWKMEHSIPGGATPLRITTTPYWQQRHARIAAAVFASTRRSECGACHQDAKAGTFAPQAIHLGAGTSTTREGG